MRRLSTYLLLSVLAFAGACSKSNYAQVEPDDLYFTNKDRKASEAYYSSSATASNNAIADASSGYSANDVSSYTNQHSPVLYTQELGSPTIQLNEQPFYSASQNPDYLVGQDVAYDEGVSDAYYTDDYNSYNTVVTEEVPQTINNYYGYNNGYGYNPYYTNRYSRWGNPYTSGFNSPFSMSIGFGYGYGYNPYSSYSYYSYYDQPSYYYYNGYLYYNRPVYYNSPYYATPFYSNYNYCYPTNDNNYNDVNTSFNGIVNAPRNSRSSVSYYANKSNYDIKRRDDINPGNGGEGGRILVDKTNGRYKSTATKESVNVNRRTSQADYAARRNSATPSSGTIQRSSDANSSYRSSTVKRSTANTRNRGSVTNNSASQRQTKNYVNRSNSQSTNVGRSSSRRSVNNSSNGATRSRYSTSSNTRSNSSYSRPKSNTSYRSTRSNSASRSSYTPRSSSSRSSGSRSSYSAPRSSSTRSSTPSRSSSSSSKSSSVKRKR